MRVVHVIPSLVKGGAERLALDIVKELSSMKNIEAKLVYFNERNYYAEEYKDVNMEFISAKVEPSILGEWHVELNEWNKLIEEFKPSVIHSHLFHADLLSRYKVLPDITYVSHCHDNMHQLRSLRTDFSFSRTRITDLYERNFMIGRYRESDNTFISISHDTTSYFQKNLPKKLSKRIVELPNAIDSKKFLSKRAKPPKVNDKLRILNVGSFLPKKNQTFLVDIGVMLQKMGVDFEITFAGVGPELNSVKKKVAEHQLESKFSFPGNIESIEQQMWKSHLLVHTAYYEPFGLVLLEAMASGLPCISLDGVGNRKLIQDGANGFFIEKANPKLFTEKIVELKNNRQLWGNLSSAGINFAGKFDIGHYAQKLLSIYNQYQK